MNVPELFIRRPVMTTLVMSGILLSGLIGYRLLPVSDLPSVDYPTIQVSAGLPGANPETMASSVATPLEKQFSIIAGVDSMSSVSTLGSVQITIQFTLDRNIDAAAQDVQAAIARAARQLPPNMPSPPTYQKVNPADSPILYLALSSPTLPLSTVDDYAETMLGFRRYFTLENRICKEIFKLASSLPKHWRNCGTIVRREKRIEAKGAVVYAHVATVSLEEGVEVHREVVLPEEYAKELEIKVVRRDRVQTAGGAVSSALYGAAFSMQAANMRAAANHEIQSPGAEITKHVQRTIWDLQPIGVNQWHVAPMNIHDEIMCVTRPDVVPSVTQVVRDSVEHFRPKVPLIGMDWNEEMANWAEKKSGTIKIRAPEMM